MGPCFSSFRWRNICVAPVNKMRRRPHPGVTVWPSGLRRQTQVLVEQSAWVRTPQLSFLILTSGRAKNKRDSTKGGTAGLWRNGSASDSRSDGWAFESLWPQFSRERVFPGYFSLSSTMDTGISQFRDSIVVSISACHADDPGSIPGRGDF